MGHHHIHGKLLGILTSLPICWAGQTLYSDTAYSDTVRSLPLTETHFLTPRLEIHITKMLAYCDKVRSLLNTAIKFSLSGGCPCRNPSIYSVALVVEYLGWVDLDLGSSLGWWASILATYYTSRMEEHLKSMFNKPGYSTNRVTLYYATEKISGCPTL